MLESLSIADLRKELKARAAKAAGTHAYGTVTAESLRDVDAATIVQILRERQEALYAIYGEDDRQEIYEMDGNDPRKSTADSVVALFRSRKIRDNGDGTSTLATEQFGATRHLCPEEPFHPACGSLLHGFLGRSHHNRHGGALR